MKGARILLLLGLGLALLLWWALVGDSEADLTRGLTESAMALDTLEAELHALDETYLPLSRQGQMLSLKSQHDRLHNGLTSLRARRLELETDGSMAQRERLPAFRELVQQSDELLGQARALHGRVQARQEFREQSSLALARARALRDQLGALQPDDAELRSRRDALTTRFAELEQGARTADRILADNLSQGMTLGHANLSALRRLIEQQEALATQLAADG